MSSFWVSLAALNASSTAVSAVGNNLANLNTTGYKATTASFRDMMSQQMGTGNATSQVGMGVMEPIVQHQFTQGNVQGTAGLFDAAINGNGFFMVKDQGGAMNYTRDGHFLLDSTGNLTNSSGEVVQGWVGANGVVNATGSTQSITLSPASLSIPIATTKFSLSANLSADAKVNDTFSTPMQVYDSLGKPHTLTVKFTNTGPGAWGYEVFGDGAEVSGGKAGTPSSIDTGTLTFDSNGVLKTPTLTAAGATKAATDSPIALKSVTWADGSTAQVLNWSFYSDSGTPLLTGYSQASATSGSAQDGLASAQPTKIQLSDGGMIVASYANGKTLNVAQIALAEVTNPESMIPIGNNDFQVSSLTSNPAIGAANTGGRGKIAAQSLETSTVDIAKEFTNLMVFQRSYQANSKVITTLDDLTQAVIGLKR